MSKNSKPRIEYKLKDFFQVNLKLENGVLLFGNKIKFFELINFLNVPIKQAAKILNLGFVKDDFVLEDEQIMELATGLDSNFEKIHPIAEENVVENIINLLAKKEFSDDAELVERAPIVTIMGHVDHGKTTLLDTIRKANVAAGEIGGITQKIGAYQVLHNGKAITFLDTPGHEAFTKMRANGSQITDIAIIVVAADDNIMPQTKESIELAKSADVQMIVAINKIDKPGANPEAVRQQMTALNVLPEEWGGNTPFVEISGLTGKGIDKLLETIQLLADVKEIKAYKNINAAGSIIESSMDKKVGNVVTLMVQQGTLKVGDTIIIDDYLTKVKMLINDKGQRIQEAFPGTPVEIFGLGSSPEVGSKFVVVNGDKNSQKIADAISAYKDEMKRKPKQALGIDELFSIAAGKAKKQYKIILKADSNGVLEAIYFKLANIENEIIEVEVIKKDISEVTKTDVDMASISKAAIYVFNTKVSEDIKKYASVKGVEIFRYDIIYKLLEEVQEKIDLAKPKVFEEKKIGEAEIMAVFDSSKYGAIAGCRIRSGKVLHNSIIEVIRKGKVVHKSKIGNLKHIKDNVKERTEGQECGITIDDFSKFEIGDSIIAYEKVEVK